MSINKVPTGKKVKGIDSKIVKLVLKLLVSGPSARVGIIYSSPSYGEWWLPSLSVFAAPSSSVSDVLLDFVNSISPPKVTGSLPPA